MSTLIIKPADRQSIDFAETERVKSASSGAVVHSTDLNNYAKKDLSNVGYPEIVYNPNNPEGSKFDGLVHTGAGDRVIESYISKDGLTWYRKWASGWKECGGRKTSTTITLPVEFSNTDYFAVTSMYTSSNNNDYNTIKSRTTTSFVVGYGSENGVYYCCGY